LGQEHPATARPFPGGGANAKMRVWSDRVERWQIAWTDKETLPSQPPQPAPQLQPQLPAKYPIPNILRPSDLAPANPAILATEEFMASVGAAAPATRD